MGYDRQAYGGDAEERREPSSMTDWVKAFYDAAKQPEWQKLHIGLDIAKPGSDRTVFFINGRNIGKTALAKRLIRKAKRRGIRVIEVEPS